jgi:hypothetical protein
MLLLCDSENKKFGIFELVSAQMMAARACTVSFLPFPSAPGLSILVLLCFLPSLPFFCCSDGSIGGFVILLDLPFYFLFVLFMHFKDFPENPSSQQDFKQHNMFNLLVV